MNKQQEENRPKPFTPSKQVVPVSIGLEDIEPMVRKSDTTFFVYVTAANIVEAMTDALACPQITEAGELKRAAVSITSSSDIELAELTKALNLLNPESNEGFDLVWEDHTDESMGEGVAIMMALGLNKRPPSGRRRRTRIGEYAAVGNHKSDDRQEVQDKIQQYWNDLKTQKLQALQNRNYEEAKRLRDLEK